MLKKILSFLCLSSCLATASHADCTLWELSDDPSFTTSSFAGTNAFDLQSVQPLLDPQVTYYLRTQDSEHDWSSARAVSARFPNYVSLDVWDKVSPFLMPDTHPAKPVLDDIFSKKKVLKSMKSLRKAGFDKATPQPHTKVIVTRHPKLSGYVFKIYTNDQKNYKGRPEWSLWVSRARGAAMVQIQIDQNSWQNFFKVPKKWIYAIPDKSKKSKGKSKGRHFILVEEDMYCVSASENLALWKTAVTRPFLSAYFAILSAVGLLDCAKPKNAYFCQDGRVAFVDTQTHARWPVAYYDLCPYLSPEMNDYWHELIQTTK